MANPTQHLTTSQTGTFYFAYGSNLSAHQMKLRLPHAASSSIPIAVVTLPSFQWIICERGYANVVSTPSTPSNVVWGILYNLDPLDEATLDQYEGHDSARNPTPTPNPDPTTVPQIPFLQGGWDYNKYYLPMQVEKWLVDPTGMCSPSLSSVTALVYVDEQRVASGRINAEYVGRMNRAIDEGVGMGMPEAWVEKTMRRWIPKGVYVHDAAYVGTDKGYVAAEERPWEGELDVRVEVGGHGEPKVVDEDGREI